MDPLTRVAARTVTLAVALMTAAALVVVPVSGPASAGPSLIRPGALPRGDNARLPHVEGTTLVAGKVRIRFQARSVRVLGTSDGTYIVGVVRKGGAKVLRVHADGSRTLVARTPDLSGMILSSDGRTVVRTFSVNGTRTLFTLWNARTGKVLRHRGYDGVVRALDARGRKVLLTRTTKPYSTFRVNTITGASERLVRRYAGVASIRAGLLATYTKDPYDGGCTVVSRLSAPRTKLWGSCRQRVEAFSPDGDRMALVHILSDGIGPDRVAVREVVGELEARYQIDGWFAQIRWETSVRLLLDAVGRHQRAVVRCAEGNCERASALRKSPSPRTTARR